MMMRKTLLALSMLGVPTGATAQDSVRLRFAPVYGVQIHRVFQTHTRMSAYARGEASGAVRSRLRESVDVGGITQLVLDGPGGRPVVHLRFDSLRTLMRDEGEPWREYGLSGADTAWIQLRVDEQMRVLETHAGGDHPGSGILVRSLTAVPDLALPEPWLRAGDAWTAELRLPLGETMGRAPLGAPSATLTSRATVVLDSVIARARDTLAYLTVSGAFTPSTVAEADGAPLHFSGGLTSVVVWSTGWRAFVSAATRIRVDIGRTERERAGRQVGERVTLETTIREQVRP